MRAIRDAFLAALLLAGVMTLGDFIWSAMHLPHRMAYGIAHGAAMCLCLGIVIGARSGRIGAGAAAGPAIGVLAALSFYALAPVIGFMAMVPAWMLFWILFAFVQRWLAPPATIGEAAMRGVTAAVLSGIAFYLISGIWTRHGPPNYPLNLAAWTIAFLPGFVALFAGPRARQKLEAGS